MLLSAEQFSRVDRMVLQCHELTTNNSRTKHHNLDTELLTHVALGDSKLIQNVRFKLGNGACRQVVAASRLFLHKQHSNKIIQMTNNTPFISYSQQQQQ